MTLRMVQVLIIFVLDLVVLWHIYQDTLREIRRLNRRG